MTAWKIAALIVGGTVATVGLLSVLATMAAVELVRSS